MYDSLFLAKDGTGVYSYLERLLSDNAVSTLHSHCGMFTLQFMLNKLPRFPHIKG